MSFTLHVFVDHDEHETLMQGWEFPDVIVGGKTYDEAEAQFKKFVGISLRAKLLELLKTVKDIPKDATMNDNDKNIIKLLVSFYEIVDSNVDSDMVAEASVDILKCLEMYFKLPSVKSAYAHIPNDTKKVIFA